MISKQKTNFQDKKLLLSFGILIFLIVVIGIIGILQIENLSQRVEDLGRHNLKLENAVLEMRVNNTVYAMGIRNYVYWKTSRYLGAVPMAVNLNNILKAEGRFREQLKIYQDYAFSPQQLEWAKQAGFSFRELAVLGKRIIILADSMQDGKGGGQINNLLMAFENHLYKIDDFLDNTMSKANLNDVQWQIDRTNSDRKAAVLFLTFTLAGTTMIGAWIALSVYVRRRQERAYREGMFSQVINLEEAQRKNLSTAVHDQMGQDLSALKIYLGIIEQGMRAERRKAEDAASTAPFAA
jgi:signal transduction histidine kinase